MTFTKQWHLHHTAYCVCHNKFLSKEQMLIDTSNLKLTLQSPFTFCRYCGIFHTNERLKFLTG